MTTGSQNFPFSSSRTGWQRGQKEIDNCDTLARKQLPTAEILHKRDVLIHCRRSVTILRKCLRGNRQRDCLLGVERTVEVTKWQRGSPFSMRLKNTQTRCFDDVEQRMLTPDLMPLFPFFFFCPSSIALLPSITTTTFQAFLLTLP